MISLKCSKSLSLLVIGFALIMCINTVTATPLPSSSYYDGSSTFYQNGLAGQLNFAVYDTQSSNEFADAGYEVPGGSNERFIYAYQIYCNEQYSTKAFSYLAISGIGEDSISSEDVIGAVKDSEEGIEPDSAYFNDSKTKAIWEFNKGYLVGGKNSWFLVYTSNEDYTTGTYEVLPTSDNEIPVANNPEPATIIMLGLGGYLVRRRKEHSLT
jgi:hypothetical protein